MRRKKRQTINLLELKPLQLAAWEVADNGSVVVLAPRFRNEFAVKWIVPHLRSPDIRIQLDRLGSFVWKRCDGRTTVEEIADTMQTEFGDTTHSLHDRLRRFLLTLEKSELVTLNEHVKEIQEK